MKTICKLSTLVFAVALFCSADDSLYCAGQDTAIYSVGPVICDVCADKFGSSSFFQLSQITGKYAIFTYGNFMVVNFPSQYAPDPGDPVVVLRISDCKKNKIALYKGMKFTDAVIAIRKMGNLKFEGVDGFSFWGELFEIVAANSN